jgi:hypothetical protein
MRDDDRDDALAQHHRHQQRRRWHHAAESQRHRIDARIAGDQWADVRLMIRDDRTERRQRIERDQYRGHGLRIEARLGKRDTTDRGAALHREQTGPASTRARRTQEREEHAVAILGDGEHLSRADDR